MYIRHIRKRLLFFGDPRRPIKIIDTPGFDDPDKNRDAIIIGELVKKLNSDVKELSMIILTLNGQDPRLDGSSKAMLTIIRQMFSVEVWDNLAVIFTRMPMDNYNIRERNKKKENHDRCIGEKFVKSIKKEFEPLPNSERLNFFFLDSHLNEEVKEARNQQFQTKEQFWKLLIKNDFFKTDKVQEVMTEYDLLSKQNEELVSMLEDQDRIFLSHETCKGGKDAWLQM